jgi:branched-chain amino acid transport system permease protein
MAVFSLSFNLMFGYTGMPSLGHALFLGLGGYGVLIQTARLGIPLWPAVLFTLAASIPLSILVGTICLKNNMRTFTFLSMGITLAVYIGMNKWVFAGGNTGLTHTFLPEWLSDFRVLYLFILTVSVCCALAMYLLTKSPFVTMLKGARENDERLIFLGVNTRRLRLRVYVISSFFASMAGILYAFRNSGAYVSSLDNMVSIQAIIMCVIGGMSNFMGPVLGAVGVTLIVNFLSLETPYYEGILGVVVLLSVYFLRDGFLAPRGPIATFARRLFVRERPAIFNKGGKP